MRQTSYVKKRAREDERGREGEGETLGLKCESEKLIPADVIWLPVLREDLNERLFFSFISNAIMFRKSQWRKR